MRSRIRQREKLFRGAHDPSQCETCGKETGFFYNGEPKKYCEPCLSLVCACGSPKTKLSGSCRRCKDHESWRTYTCGFCEREFRPKEKNRTSFCSRECSFAMQRAVGEQNRTFPSWRVYFPTCTCGETFVTRNPEKRFCSTGCVKASIERVCVECDKTFFAERWQRTCSEQCRIQSRLKARRDARKKLKAKGLAHKKHRHRARYYGVVYEPIRSVEIFIRDNWKCGICGKGILLKHKVPHPLSPTLDHVIPMSKGGSHTRANVQAAHFICNSRKGTKSKGEQLRLVG